VKHRLLAVLLCTLSLALPATQSAHAQGRVDAGEPAAYRATVREALSEYHAKNFPESRALFSEAHRLFPNARTLRGLGMVAFELRSYRESIDYLQQALDSQVKPLDGNLRAETERLLTRAERFVGKLNLSVSPPEAELLIDGNPVKLPDGKPLLLDVGEHAFEFRAEGYTPESRTLYVKGRENETWTVALNKLAPPPAPVAAVPAPEDVAREAEAAPQERAPFVNYDYQERPSRRPVYKNPWLWTSVGVVVVAAVITGVVLATRKDELDSPQVGANTPPGGVISALEGRP
jgi:hypothetical protein